MFRQLRTALRMGIVTEPAAHGEIERIGERLAAEIARRFGRSLAIRQVDAGSCNGCEPEIAGLTGPHYEAGDVWARTMVRLDEVCEAVRLIRATADHRAGGLARVPLPSLASGTHAFGLVEAWREPVWHWAVADGPASLARLKVVDPSFRNWPALEYAVRTKIVPDFPLCNKSFNLSYSASDL